jgi:tetratricopeptide (TPR) repeat protein
MFKKYKDIVLLAISLLVIFQVYISTTYPAFKNNDSPETITSAYTLGIGHPPSYPLFTLTGKIFSLLPVASPAFRINLFSSFLAILVILLAYLFIKKNMLIISGYENRVLNFIGMFILAFLYIFWNVAIEAKGGIYVLNLLLFVLFLYITILLYGKYSGKMLYLLSFIYGISLTNHWPSMILLLPIFIYNFIRFRKALKPVDFACNALLFLLGLSLYLYLPIRGAAGGTFVFMAKPDNWHDFWWTVLRSGYANQLQASFETYKNVAAEFFGFILKNYLFLIILFPFGAYSLYRTKRELFNLYSAVLLIITSAVILLNCPSKELIWVIDLFLLPVAFILFVCIILGALYLQKMLKTRLLKYTFTALLVIATMAEAVINFNGNNSASDYISYDFGKNIAKSITTDSLCLLESDYYVMPLGYFSRIEHIISDNQYQSVYSLQYNWGIENFAGKYGGIGMRTGEKEITTNVYNIIFGLNVKHPVFLSYYVRPLETAFNIKQEPAGILYKTGNDDNVVPGNEYYFDIYSYRSIFNRKLLYDKNLACLYGERMAALADENLRKYKYYDAVKWYTKALNFPLNSRADKMYNLSIAYKFMADMEDEIKYLNLAIKEKPDFKEALEAEGMICFQIQAYPLANELLGRAISLGSENKENLEKIIAQINGIDMNDQYKNMYNSAVTLLSMDEFEEASCLFDYFINKKINDVGVARNMGVYFFKHGNFRQALNYFLKEKEAGYDRDSVKNIAYTYYRLGNIDKALKVLKEGLSVFNNDPEIQNLYDQISRVKAQNKH